MNGSPPTMPKKTLPISLASAISLCSASGLIVSCLARDVDPAALAAQIAAIDDGDVQERRKDLAALEPLLVLVDGEHALPAHVPGQLPQQTLVGFEQHAFGHFQKHGCTSRGSLLSGIQTVRQRIFSGRRKSLFHHLLPFSRQQRVQVPQYSRISYREFKSPSG